MVVSSSKGQFPIYDLAFNVTCAFDTSLRSYGFSSSRYPISIDSRRSIRGRRIGNLQRRTQRIRDAPENFDSNSAVTSIEKRDGKNSNYRRIPRARETYCRYTYEYACVYNLRIGSIVASLVRTFVVPYTSRVITPM